jgi:uncharacterized BrkB/YihY/UPF0761 family membrane protein
MDDDCMGLAQQIAYSSLLAFFPAMAFVVGALGIFHLFHAVESLLDPIAGPRASLVAPARRAAPSS